MRFLTLLIIITAASLCSGCGSKMPSDFPEVAPCTVTVKNGSTPIAGAEVFLVADEQGDRAQLLGKFTIKGITDSSGTATIETIVQSVSATGAPVGGFLVYVKKDPPYPAGKPQGELDGMDENARTAYEKQLEKEYQAIPREVPAKYGRAATSGLTLQVASGSGGSLEFDVSK